MGTFDGSNEHVPYVWQHISLHILFYLQKNIYFLQETEIPSYIIEGGVVEVTKENEI